MKKILKSPVTTIVLFAVAACLLLVSTVGGARAALTYFSENYNTRVSMHDIGVTLVQDDERIAWRDYNSIADGSWDLNEGIYERDTTDGPYASLLHGIMGDETMLRYDHVYPLHLAARNSGSIDEFVRMTIYSYWVNEDGTGKNTDLNPEYIELGLEEAGLWMLDEGSTTAERRVFYYNTILHPGETTPYVCDSLKINSDVIRVVTQEVDGSGNVTTTYDYAGAHFQLKVVVDAVQTHNADDAIWSAWGRRLTFDGNTLSFVN